MSWDLSKNLLFHKIFLPFVFNEVILLFQEQNKTKKIMGTTVNKSQLFYACCVSLIVTAMTFAIRAGILTELSQTFTLTESELGWVNSMAFLGFPIAMLIGGLVYNQVGPKRMMYAAFICHLLGLVLTITAGGFIGLLVSTFFIGFANGCVEAACNPLIADMYHDNKTTMLNKFHVWFPGGIVIGSLVAFAMEGMNWQYQIAVMIIPTLIYGYLIFSTKFPESEHIESNTGENIKGLANPLFFFILICMTLTATSEFGTTQWVDRILGKAGANPMLILALVTGVMALGRYFAGGLVHRLNPSGVLFSSAILTTLGIYMLSISTGGMVYVAALIFAVGICYFWPTMIGFTAENIPKTGALGMSLVGGAGMFAMSIWNPIIGQWLEGNRMTELGASGEASVAKLEEFKTMLASGDEAANAIELAAGQATLGDLTIFPAILIVLFGGLYFYMKSRKTA
ncbi:MAG: fucose permease [Saprospiraceae bacterium]